MGGVAIPVFWAGLHERRSVNAHSARACHPERSRRILTVGCRGRERPMMLRRIQERPAPTTRGVVLRRFVQDGQDISTSLEMTQRRSVQQDAKMYNPLHTTHHPHAGIFLVTFHLSLVPSRSQYVPRNPERGVENWGQTRYSNAMETENSPHYVYVENCWVERIISASL